MISRKETPNIKEAWTESPEVALVLGSPHYLRSGETKMRDLVKIHKVGLQARGGEIVVEGVVLNLQGFLGIPQQEAGRIERLEHR